VGRRGLFPVGVTQRLLAELRIIVQLPRRHRDLTAAAVKEIAYALWNSRSTALQSNTSIATTRDQQAVMTRKR